MNVYFIPCGRLGNAIFRYLACSLFAIKYNAQYHVLTSRSMHTNIDDGDFILWMNNEIHNINNEIHTNQFVLSGYYQHDGIYKKYKNELISYMKLHDEHFVLTDGVFAGDGNLQKFFIKDLLYNNGSNKYYDTVLHIRLNDHVDIDLYIKIEYIFSLLEKVTLTQNSCILMQQYTTEFEKDFLSQIVAFIYNKYGFNITIESNDTLTDFHIMKNAKILICSTSTLSWTAAYLSDTIEKCYFPDYTTKMYSISTCKYPIDNTELYNISV